MVKRPGPSAADIAILVIADDPEHRELVVLALAEFCDRASIATAAGVTEALDFLLGRGKFRGRDARKQPQLVLLDFDLPGEGALEVLEAMRSDPQTLSVPVVMMSSTSDKAGLDTCYRAGANSVVRKTVDVQELRGKMKHVHGFWMTVNEANRDSRV